LLGFIGELEEKDKSFLTRTNITGFFGGSEFKRRKSPSAKNSRDKRWHGFNNMGVLSDPTRYP
jgi:hypothetical protein